MRPPRHHHATDERSARLQLASGELVEDRRDSHLSPEVKRLLPEVLRRVHWRDLLMWNRDGSREAEIDMGTVIGETICVETGPDDEIVFAQRPGRQGLTRFVLNRRPVPVCTAVVVLRPTTRGGYFVVTAWFGHLGACEPWDRNATDKSLRFWTTHALVLGSTPLVPGVSTTKCPHCTELPSVARPWPECIGHTQPPF